MTPMAPRPVLTQSARKLRVVVLGAAVLVPALVAASCNLEESGVPAPSGGTGGGAASSSSTGSSSSKASSSASTGTSSSSSGMGGGDAGAGSVKVQILAINDFHGNLEPPQGSGGTIKEAVLDAGPDAAPASILAGGAAYLATHIADLRAQNPNTLVVSSGDLIGASPLASALFHDEPSIEAMNLIGLDIHGVGNHEFDKGMSELLRLKYGGCSPSGCVNGMFYPGANFDFLSANVLVDPNTNKTLFPSYTIREFEGVKVGFIGMTLKETPTIVTPTGVAGLTFEDEIMTVNNLLPELKTKGVGTIVVLLHQGGFQDAAGFYNDCSNLSGAIVTIAMNIAPEVDVIASAHTHAAYNCMMNGKLVTSASSFGRVISDIDLEISKATGKVINKSAKNLIVTRTVMKDPAVDKLVSDFVALAAPLANKQIGTITGDLPAKPTPMTCNVLSAGGLVIADAQLAATQGAMFGNSLVAFMNPGGVRADLVFAASGPELMDGIVRYGEAFTVQPFGNTLTVMTLTGDQIKKVLEQQFNQTPPRILLPSSTFSYTYDAMAPLGSKIDPATMMITIGGQKTQVQPNQSYRVTVNNFLATGGDGFTELKNGTNLLGGAQDIDALVDYFKAASPISPPALDRVTVLNQPMPCP